MLTGCCISHDWREATCTMPEQCFKCQKTQGLALGHSYTAATCTEPSVCSRCGDEKEPALGHDFTEATCTEASVCTRCGEVKGKELGHNYSEAVCGEPSVCERCGDETEVRDHEYVEATCTEPKSCSRCEETFGDPLGHKWSGGKCENCDADILDAIVAIKGKRATVEDKIKLCTVNIYEDENPYDVIYDYGPEYDELVSMADWSLVFDASYYKKTFPMLAMLYHNDDKLLLKHFQTVGIHEGRQGSDDFNVGAYIMNCSKELYDAIRDDDGIYYECFYLYYMLAYDTQKNVDAVTKKNGEDNKKQYLNVLTILQKSELKGINGYRNKVDVDNVECVGEMNACANYRAYINRADDWSAHDWAYANENTIWQWEHHFNSSSYAENMVQGSITGSGSICAEKYFKSEEHYETMVDAKYNYVGLSNTYLGKKRNSNGYCQYTFDVYFTDK